jgi:hypothetical protein
LPEIESTSRTPSSELWIRVGTIQSYWDFHLLS